MRGILSMVAIFSFSLAIFLPHTSLATEAVLTVPNEEILNYKEGSTPFLDRQVVEQSPESLEHITDNFWKVRWQDENQSAQDSSFIEEAEPHVIRRSTATPDDTRFEDQWYLGETSPAINAELAWDTQTGDSSVVVAVLDSGADLDHPDLDANIWRNTDETAGNGIDDDNNGYIDDRKGYDFIDDDGVPDASPDGIDNDDFDGADSGVTHGTHVAGIIGAAGNNSTGVAGVNWDVSLMILRVLNDEGEATDEELVEAIEYAVDNGADIINMSLGGFGSSSVLRTAVAYAKDNGVLIVAAAGNNGTNINSDPFYPACYESALGVASVDEEGDASSFSNFGSDCVDIAAPGERILSTLYYDEDFGFDDLYGRLSGTSMATPVVAGVAALLKAEESSLTRSQLIDIITETAVENSLSAGYGAGYVSATTALSGINSIDNPTAPETISGYTNSNKTTEIESGERTTDKLPYFEWEAAFDTNGIDGYWVYFGTDSSANPLTEGTYQTALTFTPESQTTGNNIKKYLRIKAQDVFGNTSSDTTSFTYSVDTKVKKARNVRAPLVANGVRVKWNKVKNDHVVRYVILRKRVDSNTGYRRIATVDHPQTSYTDTRVKRGVKYRYRIRTVDDLGNRSVSETVSRRFAPRERIVVAAGEGGGPLVRVFNTRNQAFEYSWFAYDESVRHGVVVASGNVNNSRHDEIITAPEIGAAPLVKVFTAEGELLNAFMAYDENFNGGVRLAVGDTNNDGTDEIITAPGPGGSPHIKVFSGSGELLSQFIAINGSFRNGVYVTAIDWTRGNAAEIVVSTDEGGNESAYIYNARTTELLERIDLYASGFSAGIQLAARNKRNGVNHITALPKTGSMNLQHVRLTGDGALVQTGFFLDAESATYASVGAGDVVQSYTDRFIVGVATGTAASRVQVYTKSGILKTDIVPFAQFTGGVHVSAGWLP